MHAGGHLRVLDQPTERVVERECKRPVVEATPPLSGQTSLLLRMGNRAFARAIARQESAPAAATGVALARDAADGTADGGHQEQHDVSGATITTALEALIAFAEGVPELHAAAGELKVACATLRLTERDASAGDAAGAAGELLGGFIQLLIGVLKLAVDERNVKVLEHFSESACKVLDLPQHLLDAYTFVRGMTHEGQMSEKEFDEFLDSYAAIAGLAASGPAILAWLAGQGAKLELEAYLSVEAGILNSIANAFQTGKTILEVQIDDLTAAQAAVDTSTPATIADFVRKAASVLARYPEYAPDSRTISGIRRAVEELAPYQAWLGADAHEEISPAEALAPARGLLLLLRYIYDNWTAYVHEEVGRAYTSGL